MVTLSQRVESGDFPWSFQEGVLSLFGGEAEATVGAGGRVLLLGGTGVGGGDSGSWSQLLIAVRVP